MKNKYYKIILYSLCIILLLLIYLIIRSNSSYEGFDTNNQVKFLFVCHSQETVNKILKEQPEYTDILFVGSNPVEPNPRVIICRDLKDNIEDEKKLLTFTAWYAIVKNNLYVDYKYICILEYDVTIQSGTLDSIIKKSIENPDIITFNKHDGYFTTDINMDVLNNILTKHTIKYNTEQEWYPTTNQCIRRDILVDFVNWYNNEYPYIKEKDYKKLSWYHERLFSVYIHMKNKIVAVVEGISHIQARSHQNNIINE